MSKVNHSAVYIEDFIPSIWNDRLLRAPSVSPLDLCVPGQRVRDARVGVFRYTYDRSFGHAIHKTWRNTGTYVLMRSQRNEHIQFCCTWRNLHTFRGELCADLVVLCAAAGVKFPTADLMHQLSARENTSSIEGMVHGHMDYLYDMHSNPMHTQLSPPEDPIAI